jgi:hypothetical protein
MNRRKKILLAVLYAVSLLAAIVVVAILYGRGIVFRLAGVYITPGIFTFAAMVLVDVLIFLTVR